MPATVFAMIALALGGGLMGLAGVMRLRVTRQPLFAWLPLALFAAVGLAAWLDSFPALAWACLAMSVLWLALVGNRVWQSVVHVQGVLQARPRIAWALLLVAAPALTWWWAELTRPVEDAIPTPPMLTLANREVIPSPCRTDAGRSVRVHVPERDATPEEVAAAERESHLANMLTTAPAGAYCNCHGWVFTGGRYWVNSVDVPDILQDNGYTVVPRPRPGDLIVYRVEGAVVHTGIVRAADEFGVLVESKWGRRGRYVHAPEYQDYSPVFEYYRSERAGHLLAGVDANSAPDTPQIVSRPTALTQ